MTTVFTTLISAPQLRSLLDSGAPCVVIDASFDLADTDAGERSWRAAHVPGSAYLHLDRDLAGAKNGRNGRHPLPLRIDFARTLGRIGVTPHKQVVVLDRQGGTYAARAWWLLLWMGHAEVAVLDGGVEAWTQAAGGLTTEIVEPAAAPPYPERPSLVAEIGAEALRRRLGNVRLLDARAGERFRGEVEPLDPVAGHIPGALNRCFKDNLAADGLFKSAGLLRAEFAPLLGGAPIGDVVHQCGSGVTACHNLLAMEHAGLPGSVLYAGSWSEWSADPGRPVARG
jgi:thiosulfate/3-mercaptopyruvate sulfurtransferase